MRNHDHVAGGGNLRRLELKRMALSPLRIFRYVSRFLLRQFKRSGIGNLLQDVVLPSPLTCRNRLALRIDLVADPLPTLG